MTDILLITIPFDYGSLDSASSRSPTIGIAIIAAVLEQVGYKVKILDAFALNLTNKLIKSEIQKINPKVVGITSVTASYPNAMKILQIVKEIDKDITTIYGGPHVTIMPETAIKLPYCDYVVIGEGEKTIIELIDYVIKNKHKKEDIAGIWYKKGSKIKKTKQRDFIKNLDELPMPAYHLLPMHAYKSYAWLDSGRNFCTMITSRGCPFRCTYCTSSSIFGYRWRFRSAKKVLDEIDLLYNKYNVSQIYFQDDEFTVDHKRVIEICDGIINRKMNLIWECLTRVSHVNEEILKKMAQAGCKSILYGIEMGYSWGLDKIQKKITLKQSEDAVRLTKKYGMQAKVTFMIGFPWEGKKEIKQTIKFAKKLNADMTYFNTLNPYPGTPLYEQIKKEDLFVGSSDWEKYVSHGTTPVIRTRHLTAKQLAYWNGRAYLEVYLRPKFLFRKLCQMTNLKEFKRNVIAAKDLIKLSSKRILGSN